MTLAMEVLAEIRLDHVGAVVPNDSARSSFSVSAGDVVLALDADLKELGRWPGEQGTRGTHATSPGHGLALICAPDEVRLLDRAGRVLWRHQHIPWSGDFEAGCAWFDHSGQPHAVVPAPSYDDCLVLCLDLDDGNPVAVARINAAPAGIDPVHHPDGWVGLSEGEGQDATKAWWVRSASKPGKQVSIEVLDAGWDDWVLSDVDRSGTKVITTPHYAGPLLVRSFPGLEVLRAVDPPDQMRWDYTACFAGDLVVNVLLGQSGHERLVAVSEDGTIQPLTEPEGGWLIPASADSWLVATRTTIRRCRARRA